MRLWSAHGEFIGGCHYASVNPLILDIINVHANSINLEHGTVLEVKVLLCTVCSFSVTIYMDIMGT